MFVQEEHTYRRTGYAYQPDGSIVQLVQTQTQTQTCGHGGGGGNGGNRVITTPFEPPPPPPPPAMLLMDAPTPSPYAMAQMAPVPPPPPRPPVGLASMASPPPNVSTHTFLSPPRPDGSSANFTVVQGHDESGKPFRHIHSDQDYYVTKDGGIFMPHVLPPQPKFIPPGPQAFDFMTSAKIDIANWQDRISWSLYHNEENSRHLAMLEDLYHNGSLALVKYHPHEHHHSHHHHDHHYSHDHSHDYHHHHHHSRSYPHSQYGFGLGPRDKPIGPLRHFFGSHKVSRIHPHIGPIDPAIASHYPPASGKVECKLTELSNSVELKVNVKKNEHGHRRLVFVDVHDRSRITVHATWDTQCSHCPREHARWDRDVPFDLDVDSVSHIEEDGWLKITIMKRKWIL